MIKKPNHDLKAAGKVIVPILKRRSSFAQTFNVTKSGPAGKAIHFADENGSPILNVS